MDKLEGAFLLREFTQGKGAFCNIALRAEKGQNGIEILYADADYQQWDTAVRFAVSYFLEHNHLHSYSPGFRVTILFMGYFDIDTTLTAVIYTTVQALCEATNCFIPDLVWSKTHGGLVLPNRPNVISRRGSPSPQGEGAGG